VDAGELRRLGQDPWRRGHRGGPRPARRDRLARVQPGADPPKLRDARV